MSLGQFDPFYSSQVSDSSSYGLPLPPTNQWDFLEYISHILFTHLHSITKPSTTVHSAISDRLATLQKKCQRPISIILFEDRPGADLRLEGLSASCQGANTYLKLFWGRRHLVDERRIWRRVAEQIDKNINFLHEDIKKNGNDDDKKGLAFLEKHFTLCSNVAKMLCELSKEEDKFYEATLPWNIRPGATNPLGSRSRRQHLLQHLNGYKLVQVRDRETGRLVWVLDLKHRSELEAEHDASVAMVDGLKKLRLVSKEGGGDEGMDLD